VLGYVYSPHVLAHDPPPAAVQVGGRGFTLGSANVAQAALTAQAHELVERSALGNALVRSPAPAPYGALLAVHTPEYLDRLRAASAGGPWDGEYAPVTPATWEAARLTVGGVLAAVDAVLDGRIQRALVHARPAGHHAEPDRAIASTYLNNVACGVEHARARGVERMAIIDWDVHVANGAERIFWDRDEVLAISLHQQDCYPSHAGALRATGGSGADGSTVNVPLPPATTDAGYRLVFDEIVAPIVRRFKSELIMVAAGQDASVFDPTGRMLVSAAGFRTLAERVAHLADELTGGPMARRRPGGRRAGRGRRPRSGRHRGRARRPAALVHLTPPDVSSSEQPVAMDGQPPWRVHGRPEQQQPGILHPKARRQRHLDEPDRASRNVHEDLAARAARKLGAEGLRRARFVSAGERSDPTRWTHVGVGSGFTIDEPQRRAFGGLGPQRVIHAPVEAVGALVEDPQRVRIRGRGFNVVRLLTARYAREAQDRRGRHEAASSVGGG
jgi:acetoin utilization deacetylase AcuC-like enzyme